MELADGSGDHAFGLDGWAAKATDFG